ncbi:MAG: hypothetical protein JXL20_13095 [Deltaproteobacteria bacterium]|nr:hypothetical protein [Deltaproteobacteria bacterium]
MARIFQYISVSFVRRADAGRLGCGIPAKDERRGQCDMALPRKKTVTLTGIVIPADWNDQQEVVAAALATADEKEYRIAGNKKGKELLDALQRQVEVTGALKRDETGRNVITIRRYIVK